LIDDSTKLILNGLFTELCKPQVVHTNLFTVTLCIFYFFVN